jgi:hypothetical protein
MLGSCPASSLAKRKRPNPTMRTLFLTVVLSAAVAAAEPPAPQDAAFKEAQTIGSMWMDAVKKGDPSLAIQHWGYMATARESPAALSARLAAQLATQGALQSSAFLADRSIIDLAGANDQGKAKGTYITLCYFNQYANISQREYLIVHAPSVSKTMKIVGLRSEPPVVGKRALFEIAADLGQMVLLRVNGAPATHWQPYVTEATALAATRKLNLPTIPGALAEEHETTGGQLMQILVGDLEALLKPLGKDSGYLEAMTIARSFALLSVYDPGETLVAQLANLISESAKQSGLPGDLWQPLIRAVLDKKKRSAISEIVHSMAGDIAQHLGAEDTRKVVATKAKELLDTAFENMAQLPSYEVRAELTGGAKKATMDAALSLGGMDLTLRGFDAKVQRRIVLKDGSWLSMDEGKTWTRDPDVETPIGLLRTLTSPVDPAFKLTEKQQFTILGEEEISGEKLLHLKRTSDPEKPAHEYWVLISQRGPVIRRAQLTMSFGDLDASATLTYTKLGKGRAAR